MDDMNEISIMASTMSRPSTTGRRRRGSAILAGGGEAVGTSRGLYGNVESGTEVGTEVMKEQRLAE